MRKPSLPPLRLPTAMALPRPTDFQGKILDSPYLASADPNASLYAYDEDSEEEGCPPESETAEDDERPAGDVQPAKEETPAVQEAVISSTAPPTPAADPRREAQWTFHKKGRFNDLRLVVDEQEFHVNSLVMATESEFFAEELHNTNKSELTVEGLPASTAALLVEFAYRGRLDDFDTHATALLGPAIRFGMRELKAECVRSLKRSFSLENAADRTILAVANEAEELREFVGDFFRRTPGFRLDFLLSARVGELLTADPPLAVRVHRFVKTTLQPPRFDSAGCRLIAAA
ncbi:Speckle-type POZ protein-like isoform X1 [Aphelenchoides fujianensis]|nr:Speckle-type POZ protein-like isoform X1 [Aphelenchoides fujianensis]